MMTYRDITFCSARCGTKACYRNKQSIPADLPEWMPVAFSDFKDGCNKYTDISPLDELAAQAQELNQGYE